MNMVYDPGAFSPIFPKTGPPHLLRRAMQLSAVIFISFLSPGGVTYHTTYRATPLLSIPTGCA